MSTHIMIGDVREKLAELPADHFDCVVTSPPYWNLRSYLKPDHPDKAREIGLEPTLGAHLDVLVDVMRQVRRVLKPSGCMHRLKVLEKRGLLIGVKHVLGETAALSWTVTDAGREALA